jgi:hypothetical protein
MKALILTLLFAFYADAHAEQFDIDAYNALVRAQLEAIRAQRVAACPDIFNGAICN